jgi:hypothetical protein
MKVYRTALYSEPIQVIDDATRVTANYVFFENGRKEALCSHYSHFFLSWEEAYADVCRRADMRMVHAEQEYEHAKQFMERVRSLKKPEVSDA